MICLVHIKFDNNRSNSFGDYLSNKHSDRRQTDRQTETGDLVFRSLRVTKRRKNKSRESSNGLDYNSSLAYGQQVKKNPFQISNKYSLTFNSVSATSNLAFITDKLEPFSNPKQARKKHQNRMFLYRFNSVIPALV